MIYILFNTTFSVSFDTSSNPFSYISNKNKRCALFFFKHDMRDFNVAIREKGIGIHFHIIVIPGYTFVIPQSLCPIVMLCIKFSRLLISIMIINLLNSNLTVLLDPSECERPKSIMKN